MAARQKAADDASRVTEAQVQAEAARTLLQTAVAQAEQSGAELAGADLDLSYTKLVAPTDGRITRKAVEPGSYVQVGQRLFALVEPEVWVVANFKETQLRRMHPGQRVAIAIDVVNGTKIKLTATPFRTLGQMTFWIPPQPRRRWVTCDRSRWGTRPAFTICCGIWEEVSGSRW